MKLFCITIELPHDNTPENANPESVIYQTNYFCRTLRDNKTGVVYSEWDSDPKYAQRFKTETGAFGYLKDRLENTEGATVSPYPNLKTA